MPSSTSTLKAIGLNFQPNSLQVPDGSLSQADNVVIKRDQIIESRRGFKLYGNSFGTSTDTASQLFAYQNRILRHFNSTLQFDDGTSNFDSFEGEFSEVVPGLRSRSTIANGNFYFTTSDGVQKISVSDPDQFSTASGFITPAGGVKAIDLTATLNVTQGETDGFLPQDSTVAYRAVWNITDANNNLVQGSPSARAIVSNPLSTALLLDFNKLLVALDNLNQPGSLLTYGQFVATFGLPITATPTQLYTNLLALTAEVDSNLVFANTTATAPLQISSASITGGIATVNFSSGDPTTIWHIGSSILLNGFTNTNSAQVVTVTTTDASTLASTGNGSYFIVYSANNLNQYYVWYNISTQQQITITTTAGSNLATSGAGTYFTVYTAQNKQQYYFWYNTGSNTDPMIPGATGIQINCLTSDSANTIASDTIAAFSGLSAYFTVSGSGDQVVITNVQPGSTNAPNAGTAPFTFTTIASTSSVTDPNISGATGIPVIVLSTDNANAVASETISAMTGFTTDFTISGSANQVIITNTAGGNTNAPNPSIAPFSFSTVPGITASGTLSDSVQTISALTSSSIQFLTTVTGGVNVSGATINSNDFTIITQPGLPSIPATDGQLVALQTYIEAIIQQLEAEPNAVIPTYLLNEFISVIQLTTSANVTLQITIPEDITSNYFLQLYRSSIFSATQTTVLADITPDDELQLIYEAFPTASELENRSMTVVDITPASFAGADLYTNPTTGQGILQANDLPPLAHDINRFQNVIFYANTQTRNQMTLSLLGIQQMITDYNNNIIPQLTIADASGHSSTYSFILGVQQQVTVTTNAGSTLASNGNGSYFVINSAENATVYYVWYQIGTSVDPMVPGAVGIKVIALSGDSATQIATKTADAMLSVALDFTTTSNTNHVVILNTNVGYTGAPDAGTSGFTFSTISGQGERVSQETSNFICLPGAGLAGLYFTLNTAYNLDEYYIWFQVNGLGTDPHVTNEGILVSLLSTDTAAQVATKIANVLNTDYPTKFMASTIGSSLTVTNVMYGPCIPPTAGNSGFTLQIEQIGALDVVLSNSISPATAVDQTARSLVRVININQNETVYAYYISDVGSVPGQFLLESRALLNPTFYVVANNQHTGGSFSPNLSPDNSITGITTGSPTTMLITTANPHGFVNQEQVLISGSNSIPTVDGVYPITYVSPTTFRIPATILTSGNIGGIISIANAQTSQNQAKVNRVYYSKFQQPEAVPIVNYMDIGLENNAIIRIFPLRNSLFVFKQDGLYRISGTQAPFTVQLFDSSCVVIAPDTVDVSGNLVYCWTSKGISAVSEAGVTPFISRPIDSLLLNYTDTNYPSFSTATWGIGYESDNSYIVYTVENPTDTVATIGYRYNTLTNTWTAITKTNTCGLIFPYDDSMYMGAGDTNYIEQERKTFSRLDYADRELSDSLLSGYYFGNVLKFQDVNNYDVGDVIEQTQTLTIYDFNALLQKLDIDPGLTFKNYYSTLQAAPGADLRASIIALAAKLDSEPHIDTHTFSSSIATKSGTITSISATNPTIITSTNHGLVNNRLVNITGANSTPNIDGESIVTVIDANTFSIPVNVTAPGTTGFFATEDESFQDIMACYNQIIALLNADPVVVYSNYVPVSMDTVLEAIITNVNTITKDVTLNLALNFVVGPVIIYKAINCQVTYSPHTMGDALGFKQLREATMMFSNKAFTLATLSFATDLLPAFVDVPFQGDGNGIFGLGTGPFGQGFFGGGSNSAPFRTYVPRNCQRCRYIVCQFTHDTAREQFAIYGLTITGEVGLSSRAYR